MKNRTGEYADKGDYHLDLDPSWPYLPVYLEKERVVKAFLEKREKTEKIIDLGCGEGYFVKLYRKSGLNIIGLDFNYKAEHVLQGDIRKTEQPDKHYDIAMSLDVIEHLEYEQQEKAILEIARIIKPGGIFLMSIPNLGHIASRLSFLTTGKLLRTSSPDRHPGDRPINEYLEMLNPYFKIKRRIGLFPTFPIISFLTIWKPARSVFLHKIYNRILAYPNWCFLNIMELERR
ncbi:MAG: class I SAM-dependent methyltransferase [Anaerolineae bacterium]|jgi:SAM-dependent methyltransferase|nr:class I SAM-dependent methyltransferase [Anaerolineae bacterium]MBT7075624.1 class I SAM-dependent methyltransferase [Anaerolineae bacterium]MBT7783776.1 class I SAM-dependent methyltransferase [Anaerolineae bacterium]